MVNAGCMRQVLGPGALGRPRGIGWRGKWEAGSGWGTHVNPWLIHVNVWQKPLQYCKVISLQLINEKKTIKTKQNQIDYILCSQRWRSSIQSAKTRLGADCGSDHETLIAKFRLKLKKVGKTTRPFRYDLNQIPYDYTVGMRNRFKGLDLIDREPDELWTEVRDICRRQGSRPSPWKRNAKKQNGCLRRPYK